MGAIAEAVRHMMRAGMDADAIVEAVADMEAAKPARSTNAERQARYRERKRASQVTESNACYGSNVTCDPSLFPPDPLTPSQHPPLTPPTGGSSPPASQTGNGYPDEFELLWSEFPRSRNSSKAKAFKVWKRLSAHDRSQAVLGAGAYREWHETECAKRTRDPPPLLHLSTYVNERRWESLLEGT